MPPRTSVQTDLLIETPDWGKARLGVKKLVPETLNFVWENLRQKPKISPEITVTLTGDSAIKLLNWDYRGKNKPTNVLSFPLWDTPDDIPQTGENLPFGDIIISLETIRKEAVEQEKPLKDHFIHMLIHGFLHLLGYDHIEDDEAEVMEALEIKLLKKLGIKNPYEE